VVTRTPRILPLASPAASVTQQSVGERSAVRPAGSGRSATPRRPPRIAGGPAEAPPGAPADAVACKRSLRRKPTSLPGVVTFRGTSIELPCLISDLSAAGARLYLPPHSLRLIGSLEQLPDKLWLALRADRQGVPCEVRWRLTSSLGVRFLDASLPISTPQR